MRIALPLIVVMSACGPRYMTMSTCYSVDLQVGAEFAMDCKAVAFNVALAKKILDREKIVQAKDFASTFGDTSVHIVATKLFMANGSSTDGYYTPFEDIGITLGADATALLHELLHHVDVSRYGVATTYHFQWEERGWLKLDREFTAQARSPKWAQK